MGLSRLSIAKKDILHEFDDAPRRVYRLRDLQKLLTEKRAFWRLAQSTNTAEFIEWLSKRAFLRSVRLEFPRTPPTTLYVWREATPYEIAVMLGKDAYLSHYTAMFLHELTLQVPKTIYVSISQPDKRNEEIRLTQEDIDASLAKPARVSSAQALLGEHRVVKLASMRLDDGISEVSSEGRPVKITSLERTLVDSVIRPHYAGGPSQVLSAFAAARERLSTNKLTSLLRKLKPLYPYHQAVGFYMERAGYPERSLKLIERLEKPFVFYLDHNMGDTRFSERWRLHVPESIWSMV